MESNCLTDVSRNRIVNITGHHFQIQTQGICFFDLYHTLYGHIREREIEIGKKLRKQIKSLT